MLTRLLSDSKMAPKCITALQFILVSEVMNVQKAVLSSTVSTLKCPASDLNPELTQSLQFENCEWD